MKQHDKQPGPNRSRRSSATSPDEAGTGKQAGVNMQSVVSAESSSAVPVVAIGGSAGSLEAFKNFFASMPADSGAAFVVIQHLAPAHEACWRYTKKY